MGHNAAGIIIKKDNAKFSIESFANQFFANNLKIGVSGDSRYANCFCIAHTADYVIIENSNFVGELVNGTMNRHHKELFNFFEKKSLLIAYEVYNSSNTIGYALFKNGKIVRNFKIQDGEVLLDNGLQTQIEKKWQNASREIMDAGDDEFYTVVNHPDIPDCKIGLWQYAYYPLNELMENLTNFTFDSLYNEIIEYKFITIEKSMKTFWQRLKTVRWDF